MVYTMVYTIDSQATSSRVHGFEAGSSLVHIHVRKHCLSMIVHFPPAAGGGGGGGSELNRWVAAKLSRQ
jgi:hypothetical protein